MNKKYNSFKEYGAANVQEYNSSNVLIVVNPINKMFNIVFETFLNSLKEDEKLFLIAANKNYPNPPTIASGKIIGGKIIYKHLLPTLINIDKKAGREDKIKKIKGN